MSNLTAEALMARVEKAGRLYATEIKLKDGRPDTSFYANQITSILLDSKEDIRPEMLLEHFKQAFAKALRGSEPMLKAFALDGMKSAINHMLDKRGLIVLKNKSGESKKFKGLRLFISWEVSGTSVRGRKPRHFRSWHHMTPDERDDFTASLGVDEQKIRACRIREEKATAWMRS